MICTKCKKYDNNINCIPYLGNKNATYYFLGNSVKSKVHLFGKFDKNFWGLIRFSNIAEKNIAISNSYKCFTESKPTESELNKCFIHILREVNKIKPKLIIAMGETALYQTLGKTNVDRCRGKVYYSDKLKCNVYVTHFPDFEDENKKDILIEDFKNISLDLKSHTYYKAPYTLITSKEEYNLVKQKLLDSPLIYLDTETTGLDPWVDKLTLVQLGTSDGDIYLIDKLVIPDIDFKLLEIKPIVGAGFEFDAKILSTNLNIKLDNYYHDVVLAEYLLTGVGQNDLTTLTYKYVPECAGYDDEVKELGGAQNATGKMLYQYSANDIYVMYKIVEQQEIKLKEEGLWWLFKEVKMPVNKVLTNMSIRGVLYDIDMVKKMDEKYRKKGESLLKRIEGFPEIELCQDFFRRKFNPKSSQMVKWLLIDHYKLPVLKRSKKTKNPSVGQKEMEVYAKKHKNKYCKVMVDYRSNETLRSSFLGGVLPKLVNGVAHTKYGLHSTSTGRPNSTGINLLNIPRNKDIKQCLISRPGHSFVYGDFRQMELRVGGVIYNEPRLIDICNNKLRDLHCSITAKAFGRDYNEIYNGYKNGDDEITELRVKGKSIAFGVLYQIGAQGLSYDLKVKEQEAQQFINDFYTGFPDLQYYIEETKAEIIKNGYLTNYFGFKRRWIKHTSEDHATLREGVNFKVQSLAFNLLELSLISISKKFIKRNLKSKLIMQVYDSIICEVPDDEIVVVADIMENVMTTVNEPYPTLNKVKLFTDIEVGKDLLNLKKI